MLKDASIPYSDSILCSLIAMTWRLLSRKSRHKDRVHIIIYQRSAESHNHTSSPYNHTSLPLRSTNGRLQGKPPPTPQVNTPSTPTTSKREIAKTKRLKALLSAIGANGSNLKVLMESMQRKDGKGFVSTYIVPNNGTKKGAKMMGKIKSRWLSATFLWFQWSVWGSNPRPQH